MPRETHRMALSNSGLPRIFHSVDQASGRGQQNAVRWSAVQLILLVVSALFGAASKGFNIPALLGWLALAASLVPTLLLASGGAQRTWYRGRAAAESVKTLAWKYAVRGAPFDVEPGAEAAFVRNLTRILHNVRETRWEPTPVDEQDVITAQMRTLRAAPLRDRKAAYLNGRIDGQREWYTTRARQSANSARLWTAVAVLAILGGLVGGAFRAFGVVNFDALGAVAAGAAAATAWSQLKQYQSLAVAYALTAHELALVKPALLGTEDEASWTRACRDAESAISREHIMWLARGDSA